MTEREVKESKTEEKAAQVIGKAHAQFEVESQMLCLKK